MTLFRLKLALFRQILLILVFVITNVIYKIRFTTNVNTNVITSNEDGLDGLDRYAA